MSTRLATWWMFPGPGSPNHTIIGGVWVSKRKWMLLLSNIQNPEMSKSSLDKSRGDLLHFLASSKYASEYPWYKMVDITRRSWGLPDHGAACRELGRNLGWVCIWTLRKTSANSSDVHLPYFALGINNYSLKFYDTPQPRQT